VRDAIKEVNALLQERPISENDVPRLMLMLLSQSRELRGLPEEWRWHSMGGQATSPYSLSPKAGDIVIWGVSGRSKTFGVNASGTPRWEEPLGEIRVPQDVLARRPMWQAVAAVATFIKSYEKTCKGERVYAARNPLPSTL
jgi:hypothetical protein